MCHEQYGVLTAGNSELTKAIATYYAHLKSKPELLDDKMSKEYKDIYPIAFEHMLEEQVLNIERLAKNELLRPRKSMRITNQSSHSLSAWRK